MKPVQRTSATIVAPWELDEEIKRYNKQGWQVITAWYTDRSKLEICLNAIYAANTNPQDPEKIRIHL